MITLYDRQVGQPVNLILPGNVTSLTTYRDGETLTGFNMALSAFGTTGPTRMTFTPPSTGLYSFVDANGEVLCHIDVVTRSSQTYLKNIEDEALGSWTWNRVDGTLQLLRQDGSALADFAVVDTQTESSRERLL